MSFLTRSHTRLFSGYVALLSLCGATPALAQGDVERRGLELGGGLPPAGYYETLARDPLAFQFSPDNGWIRRATAIAGQRHQLRAGLFATRPRAAALTAQAPAVSGDVNLPIFLVLYANSPTPDAIFGTPAPADSFQTRLYGTDPAPPYTVHTYYQEISRELMRVNGTVLDWVRVSQDDVAYESDCNGLCTSAQLVSLMQEIVAANDDSVDYGFFDNDGPDGIPNSGDDDGLVDAIVILHPETGGECGGSNVWAHRWSYSSRSGGQTLVTADTSLSGGNIRVNDYIIQGAQGGESGCTAGQFQAIGVITHETGHLFGLPDLYDTDGGGAGLGRWGVMGSGNWNRPSSPGHMSAWSRARLGWVTEVTIAQDTTLDLSPVETADTVYAVPTNGSNEYFLLENRQRLGSEVFLLEPGLLIWHIDPDRIAQRLFFNGVNATVPYGVALEQADGLVQLENGAGSGDPGDPFPGNTNNVRFSHTTVPSSASNDGPPTYITVDSIEQLVADGPVRARISFSRPTLIAASDTLASFRLDGDTINYFDDVFENGSMHTLSMDQVQTVFDGGNRFIRYTWMSWSNGQPREHVFTATTSGDTILADVARDFWLAVFNSRAPGGGRPGDVALTIAGTVEWGANSPPCTPACDGWVAESTVVLVEATTTNNALLFDGWIETAGGQTSVYSSDLSLDITMDRPLRLSALFVERLVADLATLGTATMGALYNDTLVATGGTGFYQWRRLSGAFPLGITFNANGTAFGRPAESGDFQFDAEVTSGSQVDTIPLTLSVVEPDLDVADVVRKLVGLAGSITRDEEFFLDLLGNGNGTLDVGDFLAWVEAGAIPVSPELMEQIKALRKDP